MLLRRLNPEGEKELLSLLDSLDSFDIEPKRNSLLKNDDFTDVVSPTTEIEYQEFSSRYSAGKYLYDTFLDTDIPELEMKTGIWSWLALFFFQQLCPGCAKGTRKPGEKARWIPDPISWRKYYRHLLAGPYQIYRFHSDDPSRVMAVLCTPVHSPGDLAEQLASRQELITNKAVMAAATELYYDSENGEPKRGARSKTAGSVRRFVKVLNQFDLTWDLYAIEKEELLERLPGEFDRFQEAN